VFNVQGEAVQEDTEALRSFATPDTTRPVTHRHIPDATPMTERVAHSGYHLKHLNCLGRSNCALYGRRAYMSSSVGLLA
jgi:hypothetical protein